MLNNKTEWAKKLEWGVIIPVLILILIGMIMALSTTAMTGIVQYNDPYFFVKKHSLFLIIGLIALVIGAMIPHQWYKKHCLNGYIFGCILMALPVLSTIGIKAGGAKRWINMGFFQLQPVELMKFIIIVFLATALANKHKKLHIFKEGLLPLSIMMCIPIGILVAQPDLGNIILILMVFGALLFISGVPMKWLLSITIIGIIGVIISISTHPYQLDRVLSFINPWADPLGKNYHIIQSYTAIGSGGLFGLGIGQSKLKYFYLPLHYSDFVFSVICEENGLLVATGVLGLFGTILYKGLKIAKEATSLFSSYLATGLTLIIVIQALINMGVVVGIFPITGIPLTFISYGGTSLVMSLFIIGVILNIQLTKQEETNT